MVLYDKIGIFGEDTPSVSKLLICSEVFEDGLFLLFALSLLALSSFSLKV